MEGGWPWVVIRVIKGLRLRPPKFDFNFNFLLAITGPFSPNLVASHGHGSQQLWYKTHASP